jgi:hypothetical protein
VGIVRVATLAFWAVASVEGEQHMEVVSHIGGPILTQSGSGQICRLLNLIEIVSGAASGDRTHDILSHSQAFCR